MNVKMKKKYILCAITSVAMCLLSFGIHILTRSEDRSLKVGFIFVGDEITPYTENFIKAQNHVVSVFGDKIECVTKYNVTEDQIELPLEELVNEKCDYIIAASYGYGPVVILISYFIQKLNFACRLATMQMMSQFFQIIITVTERFIRDAIFAA